ncbi:MAG TPA: exodeoxyribonuclease V subunit alpha [Acidimicrobiales bacterium]|nr:exodeoxyribonuclease V subunit alpha [Acidimicrobiales bacterium]
MSTLLGDPFDVRLALRAPDLLRAFNDDGVLDAADVHVAVRLGRLTGELDQTVLLAAALAARAPRLGHVCTDLATIRRNVIIDTDLPVDLQALPWPEVDGWLHSVAASPLTVEGGPLRLDGDLLYLDRYWREERGVATDLAARSAEPATDVNRDVLAAGLERLFGPVRAGNPDLQRLAAASAVLRRFCVIAGGPGTGKTTTVARIVALLGEQAAAAGAVRPLIALAAPTGKAAARLEEAVHAEAIGLDVSDEIRAGLMATNASTLHRLLGWRPGSSNRFRHDRNNRLPHDAVIVDETSMVSLSLMARLVEAVRAGGRLILIGDPEQLASVEAGAVLGDIVGPAADELRMRPEARRAVAAVTAEEVPGPIPESTDASPHAPVGDGIVVLRQVHRYGGGIAEMAEAVRCGDGDATIDILRRDLPDVRWLPIDIAVAGSVRDLTAVREVVVDAGCRVTEAARAGDGRAAIAALGTCRVLCAHRRGPYGVETWMERVESWLGAELDGFAAGGSWYVGRPLLVTENDYGLRLFNGDTGVVVATAPGRVAAVFERRDQLLEFSPTRLAAVDTVYAMTVHKSQGSQFGTVAVLLPDPASPILTRELLYTAVTRARQHLLLAGTEEAVRAAVSRPIARASGLRHLLWDGGAD